MKKIIPIFEFIAEKRSFAHLFTIFSIFYLCLFAILFLVKIEISSDSGMTQTIIIGILLSLVGGLCAALSYKIVSWRTRRSLENYIGEH